MMSLYIIQNDAKKNKKIENRIYRKFGLYPIHSELEKAESELQILTCGIFSTLLFC